MSHASQISDYGWERNKEALQKQKTVSSPAALFRREQSREGSAEQKVLSPQSLRLGSWGSPSPRHGTGGSLTSRRPKVSMPHSDTSPAYRRSLCPSSHKNPQEEGFYCPGGVRHLAGKPPAAAGLSLLYSHNHLCWRGLSICTLRGFTSPSWPWHCSPLTHSPDTSLPVPHSESKALPTSFCLF